MPSPRLLSARLLGARMLDDRAAGAAIEYGIATGILAVGVVAAFSALSGKINAFMTTLF